MARFSILPIRSRKHQALRVAEKVRFLVEQALSNSAMCWFNRSNVDGSISET